jgi:hypothetical protein
MGNRNCEAALGASVTVTSEALRWTDCLIKTVTEGAIGFS